MMASAALVAPAYCQLMARYNRWMNERLYALCAELPDGERKRDRGAFFGSIHGTLNHLLWGDRMWLGRFIDEPCTAPAFGAEMFVEWEALAREREITDTKLMQWAGGLTPEWLAGFAERCRAELDWTPSVVDLGGGLGIQYVPGRVPPSISEFVGTVVWHLNDEWRARGWPSPQLVLEPGRSIVGRAGVSLYEVGAVKEVADATRYVAVDGGMSDNPRPQLYQAQYTGLLANRAGEAANGAYTIAGKHCESGDVMIRDLPLPEPRRGDLLAVAGTGAYTLTMASNYNLVPRPAAVLVADEEARVIRRRETIDDLLAKDAVD